MPYIKPEDREKFKSPTDGYCIIEDLAGIIENCGELNYVITVICQNYIKQKGLRYQNINDVVGALEGAKLELYRRVASKYEDAKIEENGDVNVLDD